MFVLWHGRPAHVFFEINEDMGEPPMPQSRQLRGWSSTVSSGISQPSMVLDLLSSS
jgi:hypothetical protein